MPFINRAGGGGLARFTDTSNANALASDILSGKTAYVNGNLITGTHTEPFGMLLVTYPSGATLTCTNVSGYKYISGTQRLYYVKEAGTCTATISAAGQESNSRTVIFTSAEEGSSKTVTVPFRLYLVKDGAEQTGYTLTAAGKKANSSAALDAHAPSISRQPTVDNLYSAQNGSGNGIVYFTLTDVDDYLTVTFGGTYKNRESTSGGICIYVWSSLGTYVTSNAVSVQTVAQGGTVNTATLSLGGLSNCVVGVMVARYSTDYAEATMTNIYLE